MTMRLPMAPTDSMFLLGESPDHPMHVGGLLLLQPPDNSDATELRERFDELRPTCGRRPGRVARRCAATLRQHHCGASGPFGR